MRTAPTSAGTPDSLLPRVRLPVLAIASLYFGRRALHAVCGIGREGESKHARQHDDVVTPSESTPQFPPRCDPVRGRTRPGRQRGDFDRCRFVLCETTFEVIGILYGYSNLVQYGPDYPMQEGRDYVMLDHSRLKRTRNSQGIMIGSARTNPGKLVTCKADLADAEKTAQLKTVYDALCSLGVDALVSIGGDDTLKTANKFQMFQDCLPAGSKKIPVVHVPKTIDNDYMGIDFTFGYFTAVETLAGEIRNLLADAESTRSYFLAETMGRSAGWIAYGAAIAGEASLVISVEDITGKYRQEEEVDQSQDRREDETRGDEY